ncbi:MULTISPECIES: hypothetical protein [unclassified Streptomyces]|uniref:hypothetical protein n=1 Tax=unclassified Streptomyces TaxID=2593676 RepID=UPI0036E01EA3
MLGSTSAVRLWCHHSRTRFGLGLLFLEDGTVVGRALIQFGDTADGFTANLTVYFPTSCPKDVLDHHLRHYAVEFRNWIVAAAEARA